MTALESHQMLRQKLHHTFQVLRNQASAIFGYRERNRWAEDLVDQLADRLEKITDRVETAEGDRAKIEFATQLGWGDRTYIEFEQAFSVGTTLNLLMEIHVRPEFSGKGPYSKLTKLAVSLEAKPELSTSGTTRSLEDTVALVQLLNDVVAFSNKFRLALASIRFTIDKL